MRMLLVNEAYAVIVNTARPHSEAFTKSLQSGYGSPLRYGATVRFFWGGGEL